MAVVIQELVIQNKILDDGLNNKDLILENLLKQMKILKAQVKNLKDIVDGNNNDHER